MEGDFVVYFLTNKSGKRYIGITSNLEKRLLEHKVGKSIFTRNKGPWNLEWKSKILNHSEALILEKLCKRQKGGKGLESIKVVWGDS